jgi:hypothetical protein
VSARLLTGDEAGTDAHRVSAQREHFPDVLRSADAPGGDNGHLHRLQHRAKQLEERHRSAHMAAGLPTLGHDEVTARSLRGDGLLH